MELIFKTEDHYFYHQQWKDLSHLYQFKHSVVLPKATYSPWLADADFIAIYESVKNNTLVDIYRCYELWQLAKQTNKLTGELVEVGVWKGGTGAILAKASSSPVYLCDTFAGVVKAGEKDNRYVGGEHSDTSEAIVAELFKNLGLSNYKILKGIFPDESSGSINDKEFRFCHIDVDVYNSAKEIFDWVIGRLVTGGIIVFDDYGFAACEGVTALANELGLREDVIMVHNINGHAVFIKIK